MTVSPQPQNNKSYTIYVLIDPRDNRPRYIGMTNDIYSRFTQHLRGDGCNIAKNTWIAELKQESMFPIMKALEIVETVELARQRETHWIHYHKFIGFILLNQKVPTMHVKPSASKPATSEEGRQSGRRSKYDQVREIIIHKHATGEWPTNISSDMKSWYQFYYFTKPNKSKDGEKYSRHVNSYARGRQWIAEHKASLAQK